MFLLLRAVLDAAAAIRCGAADAPGVLVCCCWSVAAYLHSTSHAGGFYTLATADVDLAGPNPAIRHCCCVAHIVAALMGALVIHCDVVVAAVLGVVPLVVVVVGSLGAHQAAAAVAGLFVSHPAAVAVLAAPPTAVAAVGLRVAPPLAVGLLVRWRRFQIEQMHCG